ncbi:MAG: hypothetical protein AUJ23_01225 [Candidatus Magasanikbacteria bacterium CG1_02_32_51]|uniref:Glycosyltransferase 2-like domain-containing protein n=1 Tax=Candidatus Magasanikbacteria bacterium CG1_02_32_51 TaxID=1805238 RepID=A0A1J4U5N7_9BACT|nr:MAG: hypothetical protein AUJ23_01225 [Candidatus Magasanikbacteria bacterium CG1_02_32_51]
MAIKISIIMLTYNRAHYLPMAIDSVFSQSFSDWELIVVDGGSTDDTENLIKNYQDKDSRIVYIRKDKVLGISKCRNVGLNLAKGEYIAVLDSDDIWCDKEKLAKQLDFLLKNSDCFLVGGGVIVIDEHGVEKSRYLHAITDEEIKKQILLRNQFAHSAVLYRRDKAQAVGGYALDVKIGEEYDLWLRMGRFGTFYNLKDYVVNYRIHNQGACVVDRLGGALDTLKIIKKYRHNYPNYFLAWIKAILRMGYYLWLKFTDRFRF